MCKKLGILGATWNAIWGKDLGYYPRTTEGQIKSADLIKDIAIQLKDFKFNTLCDAEPYLDRAKESLSEVKELTEYQDQKTTRLLTILAFLTAAAGAVFSKVLDIYPLHLPLQGWTVEALIPLMYGLFGVYMLSVSLGALISFHAMQTRFLLPKDHDTVNGGPKSFLFFKYIMTAEPQKWGSSFSSPTPELLTAYYKNYVIETYLIAAKIGDKVRYLEPAQRLLQWAIKVLVLWIISLAACLYFVPQQKESKVPNNPTNEQKALNNPTTGQAKSPGKPAKSK